MTLKVWSLPRSHEKKEEVTLTNQNPLMGTAPASPGMQMLPFSERMFVDTRTVWLRGEVRDENSNELMERIMFLSAKDPVADIILCINSPGGSVTAGSGIFDVMEAVPNDIVTVGIGMAASMGQFLLTAGTPGKRFATNNLELLLHQPHGGAGGTYGDIRTQAALILRMKDRLASVTAKRTGKTLEQVNIDGDRDHWYDAKESLEYGFVDHILTSMNEPYEISKTLGTNTKNQTKGSN